MYLYTQLQDPKWDPSVQKIILEPEPLIALYDIYLEQNRQREEERLAKELEEASLEEATATTTAPSPALGTTNSNVHSLDFSDSLEF